MAIAGRVAIVPKGEYSNEVTYDKLDLVMYNNDAYIAKKTSTGIEPTNEEYWMLILNNVVAEDLENIINGTTAVGNALKLNGLTAEEFARNKDFHRSDTYTYMESGTGEELYRLQLQSGEVKVWKSTDNGTTWTDLGSVSDGGNADTVGGFHASRFVQNIVISSENKTDDPNTTEKSRIRTAHANCPTANVEYIIDTTFTDSTANNYERRQTAYGTGGNNVVYNRAKRYGGAWSAWKKVANADEVLPLDGSVPMSGSLGLNVNGGSFRISPTNIQTQLVANGSATQGFRVLSIVTHDYTANDADALRFEGYDGNTNATYTVLHTGNSQKVVTSASAPSDTSALWIDTTNKKVKAYIDGAWTAMA